MKRIVIKMTPKTVLLIEQEVMLDGASSAVTLMLLPKAKDGGYHYVMAMTKGSKEPCYVSRGILT